MAENIGSWRVMEKARMRYEGFASYFGLANLKKYVAEQEWWRPPPAASGYRAADRYGLN